MLALTSSPDGAFLTLLGGLSLISIEFLRPGRVVPGVAGAVLAVLALSAFARFTLAPAGLVLVLTGLALLGVQAFARARWLPGAAAAILLVVGVRRLVEAPAPISLAASLLAAPFSGITAFLLWIAVRARRNKRAGG